MKNFASDSATKVNFVEGNQDAQRKNAGNKRKFSDAAKVIEKGNLELNFTFGKKLLLLNVLHILEIRKKSYVYKFIL